MARDARLLGAKVVVVHGETVTVVEPVEPGTNMASISSDYVDVLARPRLITLEEARIAEEKHIPRSVCAQGA